MADPVSYAVGSAVLTATGSFAVASTAATIAYVAVIAAPIVASVVVSERQRRAASNARGLVNDDRALQQAIPKAAPEHMLLLGYAHIAGTPFFVRGNEDTRPYYYRGVLLAAHECDGLDSVWINGTRVFIDDDGYAISTPFNDGSTQFIRVSFRSGTLAQAIDTILNADFTLPSTYRQRGHATAVIKAHYGADDDKHRELYGDGDFNPLFRVRGAKVFDPRGLNQSIGDASSWAWSRNAALNAAHYLCWIYPGMRSRLDWDRIGEAADVCDRVVWTKAGDPIAQFTLDGAILSSDPVPDAVSDLLSACGGRLIRRAGKYYIRPAQRETSTGTLHAGNLRGSVQYSNGLPVGQLSNTLNPEFMSPERGYKIVPGPVISDSADVTADGQERARTERYPFSETWPRVARLATIEYREGRAQETVTCGVDISARGWDAGRVITLDLGQFNSRLTGLWRIVRKAWSDGLMGYVLELRRYDDTAYDFTPSSDEADFTIDEDSDL